MLDTDEEQRGNWLQRNMLGLITLVLGGGSAALLLVFVSTLQDSQPTAPPPEQMVTLLNTPPPPPPPEVEEEPPPPEEEEIVEPEIQEPEPLEPEPIEQLDEPPPAGDLGIDAEGTGPGDAFGLVGRPGGSRLGRDGQGGATAERWYAGVVQRSITSAIRRHDKLRFSQFRGTRMDVWVDSSGRIVRVQLLESTGVPEIDTVLAGQALQGVVLDRPPPQDLLSSSGLVHVKIRTAARAATAG